MLVYNHINMNKSGYNFFIAAYGTLSVCAAAYSVLLLTEMYKNGVNTANLMSLALSIGATLYTKQRAQSVWHDKNNQR